MGKYLLNGLILLIIHRDIKIISNEVINEFSKKIPKKITIVIYVRNLSYFCINN